MCLYTALLPEFDGKRPSSAQNVIGNFFGSHREASVTMNTTCTRTVGAGCSHDAENGRVGRDLRRIPPLR